MLNLRLRTLRQPALPWQSCTALLLALSAAACSGAPTPKQLHDEALDALAKGDFERAVRKLERAVAASRGTHEHSDLAYELVLARAQVDPSEAQIEFLQLEADAPQALSEQRYHEFARRLRDVGEAQSSLNIVHAGLKCFGTTEAPRLVELLAQLEADAESNAELHARLVGLGYLSPR